MNQNKELLIELKSILKEENIVLDSPMKDHTSFKLGGPADIIVYPTNYEEVKEIIKLCNKHNESYFILGNGSNLLVKDGGIRGVVIKFSKLEKVEVAEYRIIPKCGVLLCDVSDAAQ